MTGRKGLVEVSLETFGMKLEIFQIVQRSVTVTECLAHMVIFFFSFLRHKKKTNATVQEWAKDVKITVCKSRNTNAKTQKRKSKQIKILTSFIIKEKSYKI